MSVQSAAAGVAADRSSNAAPPEPRERPRSYFAEGGRRCLITGVVMLGLTVSLWLVHWHGLDYPAQLYRVGLVRRQGLSLWDANWYGGHYTPAYGVLVPLIASVLGLGFVSIVSTLGSVVVFERLLTDARMPHITLGTSAFAYMMLINMYEGRLPFALGVFFGLLAVAFARRDRWWWTVVATILTILSSPVAGAFVALGFAAWALALHVPAVTVRGFAWRALPWRELLRTRQVVIAALALVVTTSISLSFPEGGYFPFGLSFLVAVLAVGVAVWVLLRDTAPAIRWGFAIAAFVAIPLFAVPNPMGSNLARLAVIGGPLLLAAPRRYTRWQIVVCLFLLGWQTQPLLRLPASVENPSAQASYFAPLIQELRSRDAGPVRLEIPTTVGHWEAAYIAKDFPLARGWERQLDLRYNDVLYDPSMTSAQYQDWLIDNGVGYVAVPDVPLESEADREVAIVKQAPYLDLVWSNDHWQLYQVQGSPELVSGPARLEKMAADRVRLDVFGFGAITIRMRWTSHLTVMHGHGCLSQSPEGWTMLEPLRTGRFVLSTELLGEQPAPCN